MQGSHGRISFLVCLCCLLGTFTNPVALAQNSGSGRRQGSSGVPGYDQAYVHTPWTDDDPVIPNYSNTVVVPSFGGGYGTWWGNSGGYYGYGGSGCYRPYDPWYGGYSPYGYGNGCGYGNGYGYGNPYGYGYGYCRRPIVYPPVFVGLSTFLGPGYGNIMGFNNPISPFAINPPALGNGLGAGMAPFVVNANNNANQNNNVVNNNAAGGNRRARAGNAGNKPGFGELAPRNAEDLVIKKPRVANQQAKLSARRYVQLGDESFQAQKFAQAYDRYEKGRQLAPDLADAYFRTGFSLVAMSKHDRAAQLIQRGLELDAQWPQSDFHLKQIYADNKIAQTAHLERLAADAVKDEKNGDLYFLLGVSLFFGENPQRALPFLKKADELGVPQEYLQGFVDRLDPPLQAKQEADQDKRRF